MANSPQARKRARQAEGRALVTRFLACSHHDQEVQAALAANDADAATAAFTDAQPVIDAMVNKGIFSANKAARTKSRLNARIKALKAA